MTSVTSASGEAVHDFVVRPMTSADIGAVVELQMAFLEGSIVTQFGRGFLEAFHRAALAPPSSLALVAAAPDGAIGGFTLGSIDVAAFNRHVKPRVLPPLLRALLTARGARAVASVVRSLVEPEPQPYMPAELLLLVVDARRRRQGLGQTLLAALEAAFATDGVTRYRVAVRSHLAVARAFYGALGFEVEQQLTVLGSPMTYLTKRVAR